MGGIQNCPVRVEDINIAENIFGPDMATLKGKSTRKTPKPVLQDWIELPKEILEKHSKIELCMDTMYVNGVGLMTAIDRTIKYRSVEYIESKEPQEHLRALSAIVNRYNKAGYYVNMVYCDWEFKPIFKDAWDQLQLTINYANTDDHVAEAERNNRFLKERFRTNFTIYRLKPSPGL